MNTTINLGEMNNLKIMRQTDNGFYLESEDESEVLLPNAFITDEMNIGDIINVFIYTDSEDRLIATTIVPKALKDQFVFAEVVDVIRFGAFVDIGLAKDLLVPKNKQKTPFSIGERRIIRVVEDQQTHRLIGVEKITSFLSSDTKHLKRNDEVSILVIAMTPLGFKVIVDHSYEGMIYKNEIFEKISTGDTKKAYVKTVRDDGKLDISLQPIGVQNVDTGCETIIELLKNNNKFLPYNYKSSPEAIKNIFKLSKKNYKKALTTLHDNNKIEIDQDGIKLINNK